MSWLYLPLLLVGVDWGDEAPGRRPPLSKIKEIRATRIKKPATQKNQL
jgi:hypothetical protein